MKKYILLGFMAAAVAGFGVGCASVEEDDDATARRTTTQSTTVRERHVAPVSTGVTTTRETAVRTY